MGEIEIMLTIRRGVTALAGILSLFACPAFADPARGFDFDGDPTAFKIADDSLGLETLGITSERERRPATTTEEAQAEALFPLLGSDDRIVLGDLAQAAEFHPETDRWTDRNNRIRISLWMGQWFFSREMRIHNASVVGLRLNWEVPGFIGIRFDSGLAPIARMRTRIPIPGDPNSPNSERAVDGYVHSHHLSIGIFNPELSVENLSLWAGFGFGLWFYQFDEEEVYRNAANDQIDAEWDDVNFGTNIFVSLDYKIADIFHVGIMYRLHAIHAPQTDDGRFFDVAVNGTFLPESTSDRNDGIVDDFAIANEITFHLSILF
jgi:hypothetical protein